MNILVIGSGGREHAVIKAIKKNPAVETIYCLPGNGGIAADATCVNIGAKDIDGIVKFATENKIDYAVVTPDDPLVLGCVDALTEIGIPCFGPDKKAAIIEGSKAFSKDLMKKYNIPTAAYEIFDDMDKAIAYLQDKDMPIVIKADGLALGKGVIIAQNLSEAEEAVRSMMADKVFGASGDHVVIEEFLTGPEVSVLAFTDGKTLIPMVSSMDHKRAHDNDEGLNTGGMGTIAPNPYYTSDIAAECMETIFIPTMNAMNAEGRTFKGCLYFGLMLTPKGPKVIEYNCRFGDPETQVVLPLLESDLLTVMQAVTNETLAGLRIYKVSVNVVNKNGNASEATYTGYKLIDVLEALGITDYSTVKVIANDGYESELTAEQATSEYTLIAIEKDKETGEDGTIWVAPCLETSSSSYCKLVVEITAE